MLMVLVNGVRGGCGPDDVLAGELVYEGVGGAQPGEQPPVPGVYSIYRT